MPRFSAPARWGSPPACCSPRTGSQSPLSSAGRRRPLRRGGAPGAPARLARGDRRRPGSDGRRPREATVGCPGERYELIYEAVGEDLTHKRAALLDAERALADGGVLVTTTSSLPVSELAAPLAAPQRFAAWHWFHPADLLALVEIVPGAGTSPDVVDRLRDWSLALGKRPIVLRRDVRGFIANRLQYALLREAYALVQAASATSPTSTPPLPPGSAPGGPRWVRSRRWTSPGLTSTPLSPSSCSRAVGDVRRARGPTQLRADGARGARSGAGLLGAYPPERLAALEELRDRTLVALRDDDR